MVMDSESTGPITVTVEDAENALMLFPAEEERAPADRAGKDARASDSSRGLIERQPHPPIAADMFGEWRPFPARPASIFLIKKRSSLRAHTCFCAALRRLVW